MVDGVFGLDEERTILVSDRTESAIFETDSMD